MNITLNLTEQDIQTAVADYIRNNGYAIEDPTAVVFTDAATGLSASLEVDMNATTSQVPEDKPEPKKRTRRSKAQMEADDAKALEEATAATTAEDKGTPEPEAEEKSDEPEQGNIEDLEKSKEPEAVSQPGSGSLFATA